MYPTIKSSATLWTSLGLVLKKRAHRGGGSGSNSWSQLMFTFGRQCRFYKIPSLFRSRVFCGCFIFALFSCFLLFVWDYNLFQWVPKDPLCALFYSNITRHVLHSPFTFQINEWMARGTTQGCRQRKGGFCTAHMGAQRQNHLLEKPHLCSAMHRCVYGLYKRQGEPPHEHLGSPRSTNPHWLSASDSRREM